MSARHSLRWITIWFLLVVMLLAVCSSLAWRWLNEEYLAIRFIRLEGALQNLDRSRIERILMPLVNTSLVSVDLNLLKEKASSLPWINRVEVERVWPYTVVLRLIEQTPYFRWGIGGLLNDEGKRFTPAATDQFSGLPVIYAPDGAELRLYKVLKKIRGKLKPHGLKVISMNVSNRQAWSVMMDGDLELQLGRHQPLEMFDRFLRILPLLGRSRVDAIQRVDMRYPNGFSVGLKPDAIIQWE